MTGATATSLPIRGGTWPGGAAYVDGTFCPIEEAKLSVLDWGLTRSDCTYDVVHVWDGRFFRLGAHLERFRAGLERLRLQPGVDPDELEAILHGCVGRTGLREAYVSMTCTRGRPAPGSRDPRTCRNTLYCFAIPFVWIVAPEQQETSGGNLWISDIPRIPPESVDPSVKNYHWLDLQTALWQAYDRGAQLVVLRDADGAISEGPGYNVFAFTEGRWITPARGTLRGITRRTFIELCDELGQPVEEATLTAEALRGADEVVVTSTAGGIMPVGVVDGSPVGAGGPGPLTAALRQRYWDRHHDSAWSTPVRYDAEEAEASDRH